MTEEVIIEGGRITSGRLTLARALSEQCAVEALVDGERETILPLKSDGGRLYAIPVGDLLNALPVEEAVKCIFEGIDAHRAGKQFHEGTYAKPGTGVPDDEYQRGYEWRKGWNEAALGRV